MPEIVDAVASLVSQFPSLAAPLSQFIRTLTAIAEVPPPLVDSEKQLVDATDALVRVSLGVALLAYKPVTDVVEVDGRQYRRLKQRSVGRYFGLRGVTTVERSLYREIGVRNGATVVPLELRAGIVDGLWTPLAAAAAGHLLQDEPS